MHAHRRPRRVFRVLLGAVAIATALGGVLLLSDTEGGHAARLPVSATETPSSTATSAGPKLVRTLATGPGPAGELIIPTLDVNAPLVWTSITAGQFDVPADVSSVGVWKNGARPGSTSGALVAAGHVGDNEDQPGALHDLTGIQAGALLDVVDPDGQKFTYRVATVRKYGKSDLPSDLTSSKTHVLRLISCARRVTTDNGRAFHYTDNVVVTAVPQGEAS